MSAESSSAVGWSGLLTPVSPGEGITSRADDPRLAEVAEGWKGNLESLRHGRPVLIGFPQDEGVRRNQGRVGAALAPAAIRRWLYRLAAVDPESNANLAGLLDLGDLVDSDDLEVSQVLLGQVISDLLRRGCVPIVLGGGHETAFGSYLGYTRQELDVAVLNVDAHLDVRPLIEGRGHSGSPFRQMMEHPARPLPGERYVCLGAQPASINREHVRYMRDKGGQVIWASDTRSRLIERFVQARERFEAARCRIHVSLDADVVRAADVPGVSAPAPAGLDGIEVIEWSKIAGGSPGVSSFELVEINPRFDVDDRSARWAALVIWNFLAGLVRS